jgi:hypothetical protein
MKARAGSELKRKQIGRATIKLAPLEPPLAPRLSFLRISETVPCHSSNAAFDRMGQKGLKRGGRAQATMPIPPGAAGCQDTCRDATQSQGSYCDTSHCRKQPQRHAPQRAETARDSADGDDTSRNSSYGDDAVGNVPQGQYGSGVPSALPLGDVRAQGDFAQRPAEKLDLRSPADPARTLHRTPRSDSDVLSGRSRLSFAGSSLQSSCRGRHN